MKILRCWCSNPTGGKLFAINLLFTTKQYKVDNIDNFVYYGKTRLADPSGVVGVRQGRVLPRGPNSFIFMQFSAKNLKK